LTAGELQMAAIDLSYILRETDGYDLEQIIADCDRGFQPSKVGENLTFGQRDIAELLHRTFNVEIGRCQQAVSDALAGTNWERRLLLAIHEFAQRIREDRRQPRRTLLDDFNQFGLDAMLEYGSGRTDYPDDPKRSQERQTGPSVRIVAEGRQS